MSPTVLSGLTAALGSPPDPRVLVGFDTCDDAGVYLINPGQALVQTVDMITPVSDDPRTFGRVAAANSLSDVYAMGGVPITALNICCFPLRANPSDLQEILVGGMEKIREAGAHLLGGHSVTNEELMYGLSVTGLVRPEDVKTNASARAGDALVLTKPIGTGVVIGGRRKKARIVPDDLYRRVMESMSALNATAGRLMVEHEASAATDITGFGLAGHAGEIARASEVGIRLRAGQVPFFEQATDLVRRGITTRVTGTNREYVECILHVEEGIDPDLLTLFFDPQTSGGLLVSIAADRAGALVDSLRREGVHEARIVGEVFESPGPRLEIVN